MTFPPVPVFPKAIDTDHELYLVHNTTETRICVDNVPWSQEIEIVPVSSTSVEIWADNGFANIEGELLYYETVEKDVNGKVNKLKKCARNLGGEDTKLNKKGTWIRSFVVAEHHNQLVDGILNAENFIGFNFDPRQETLDWRIRNLEGLDIIFDDFTCPDIVFTFNIIEDDPVTGKLAEYLIEIQGTGGAPTGLISIITLSFGDGATTDILEGTHRYAVNAQIDPVITVINDSCEIIQTPVNRINPLEPPALVLASFDIPIPEIPEFPDFTFVPCDVPEVDINLPPLIFPCISLEGQIGPLPSVIVGPDINMVSNVTITANNPIQILQSIVTIEGGPIIIPSIVVFDPPVPPTIIIDPPIPPTIVVVTQSNIALTLDAADLPRLEVDWGAPPEMEVALTLAKEAKTPEMFAADPAIVRDFGEEFADLFEASQTMKVEYESVGIPEEIRIIPPKMPNVRVDSSDMPRTIKLDCTEAKIPTDIVIHGPETPIPNSIRLNGDDLPEDIGLVYKGKGIKVDTEGVSIKLEMEKEIPTRILVEMPKPIPEKIIIDASGIPDKIVLEAPEGIPLLIPEDIGIPLVMPENPEIEMVWKGSPIEVKITMDEVLNKDADGRNCVMITPCPIG
mgnify:CR=1 FL=1|jgi:hypothetical protein